MPKRFTASTAIATILFATILFLGCQKKEEARVEKPAPAPVEVITIKKAPLPLWTEFVGKTEANKVVDVVARVTGRLEKIHFASGAKVNKGDILFTIEPTDYSAQVDKDRAKLAQDEASLSLAKNDVARYKPLVEKELAPREKLDQLVAKQKEVEAMIKADKAIIAQASLNLDYTKVRAEISGRIGRNLVDIGNVVGTSPQNSILATIVNDDPMFVYFSPTNVQAQKIQKYSSSLKMPVIAYQPDAIIDGKVESYSGEVDFIDNITDQTTGTVTMRASLKNPKNSLSSGAFVDVKLFISDKIPVIAVPKSAVGENQLGSFVYVVNDKGTLVATQIKPRLSNKEIVIVDDGLKDGDKVVVSAILKLSEGDTVAPKESTKALLPTKFE